MPHSATRAESMRRYHASQSPEDRQARARHARRAQAVREIVESWPTLDEATQQKLRALLRPVGGDAA